MRRKPILGETLFDLNVGNAAGRGREQVLKPVTVVKVGRVYFTCSPGGPSHYETTYRIDNWGEKTEYMPNHRLYENPQEWEDEREAREIARELKEVLNGYGPCRIPLDTLRLIKRAVETSTGKTI